MVTNREANQSPFVLKYDQSGNVIIIRASGPTGGVIQGTIQQTNEGKSFLVAGTGIAIVSSSMGQVTISAAGTSSPSGPAGGDLSGSYPNPTVVDLTIAGQSTGDLLYFDGANWVTLNPGAPGDHLKMNGGIPAWLPDVPDKPFDDGISYVVLGLSGSVPNARQLAVSGGISMVDGGAGSTVTLFQNDSVLATLSGSRFHGNITVQGTGSFEQGISGSLTKLVDGRSYLVQGTGITITSQSNGQVTIASTVASTIAADVSASYIVVGLTSSLPNERNLASGSGIRMVDGGPGGPFTVSIDDSVVATVSGTLFQGSIETVGTGSFRSGISGSLTQLTNGTSYLVAGLGVLVVSQSNGQITVSINDSVVAAVSGTRFTGNIRVNGTGSFDQGLSGSLTRLVDGTSYLVAGANITIVSQSNGQVTISSTATAVSASGWYDSGSQLFTTSSVYIGVGARSAAGTDANFFVSGAIGSRGTATSGSAVFGGDLFVSGVSYFSSGASGSLTRLTDGRSFIAAGTNIIVSSGSNGQVTISATAAPVSSSGWYDSGSQLFTTSSVYIGIATRSLAGSDANFFVSGAIGSRGSAVSGTSVFGGDMFVSGASFFGGGLSGSLTRLIDGTSFLVAGTNVTIVSTSNGQIIISATASGSSGSAGSTGSQPWTDVGGAIYTTSSVSIGTASIASSQGSDVRFFVSGAIGSRGVSGSQGTSLFGGDVFVSGTLYASRSISGSLTRLVDGTSYLVAGTNVTITTSSKGQVTVNVPNIAQESLNIVPNPAEVSGTTETIVGSIFVPGTTFSSARTMLGSTGMNDSGTLRIRRFTTSEVILTLGGLTGNLADQASTGTVIFPVEDWYDIYLSNSSVSGSALCNGLKLVGNDSPREKAINFVPSSRTASGTTETIVGSIYVRSGTFSSVVAMLGAQSANDTGALRIRRFTNSNLIVTLSDVSGTLHHVASTGSVTFPATDWYDFLLYNSSISGSALCNGVKMIG